MKSVKDGFLDYLIWITILVSFGGGLIAFGLASERMWVWVGKRYGLDTFKPLLERGFKRK